MSKRACVTIWRTSASTDARSSVAAEISAHTAEEAFDQQWMRSVLRSEIASLQETLVATGRELAYDLFAAIDLEPEFEGRPNYTRLGEEHGITAQRVKSELDHARRVVRRLVYTNIQDYSASEDEATEEFRELFPD